MTTSELLKQAREYEKKRISEISPEERPTYHVTGGAGWINDPNGFSYYKGQYHLFYQYYPYANEWGPMHWGHVVSRDLIKWERRPAAMAPDQEYDNAGCFSGSALELADGRHLLMYTGVRKVIEGDGSRRDHQTQCMAFGDGSISVIRKYGRRRTVRFMQWRQMPTQKETVLFFCIKARMRFTGNFAVLLIPAAKSLAGCGNVRISFPWTESRFLW